MSMLRSSTNWLLRLHRGKRQPLPDHPKSIFVLRNNDLGDVLTTTPLFEALRIRFPRAEIIAGVGDWAKPILEANPHINEVLPVNAPWHNKNNTCYPANSLQGINQAMAYIFGSTESKSLAARKFEVGIDVLGSPQGTLLMQRAGIKVKVGVKGYAGGERGCDAYIPYAPEKHVSSMALEFAELLKQASQSEARPQIYLTNEEQQAGASVWDDFVQKGLKVVIQPSSGLPEKNWPSEYYQALVKSALELNKSTRITLIGSSKDKETCAQVAGSFPVKVMAGQLSLRHTFALISDADLVVCNSSMGMHAAAAFRKPCIVLLGEGFQDAAAHRLQWCYPETLILGKGGDRTQIYCPEEVATAISQALAA